MLFKIFFLETIILFVDEPKCSLSSPGYLITKKNRLMYYIKGGLQGRIFIKLILFLIHICYTNIILSSITEREFSETNILDLKFFFIFFLKWINSNKFESIPLHKNIKSTLTLSINVRLKVATVLCNLNSSVIDQKNEFNLKNRTMKKNSITTIYI